MRYELQAMIKPPFIGVVTRTLHWQGCWLLPIKPPFIGVVTRTMARAWACSC